MSKSTGSDEAFLRLLRPHEKHTCYLSKKRRAVTPICVHLSAFPLRNEHRCQKEVCQVVKLSPGFLRSYGKQRKPQCFHSFHRAPLVLTQRKTENFFSSPSSNFYSIFGLIKGHSKTLGPNKVDVAEPKGKTKILMNTIKHNCTPKYVAIFKQPPPFS